MAQLDTTSIVDSAHENLVVNAQNWSDGSVPDLYSNCTTGPVCSHENANLSTFEPIRSTLSGIIFVFDGQGSQTPGMVMELFHLSAASRRSLIASDRMCAQFGYYQLLDYLVDGNAQQSDVADPVGSPREEHQPRMKRHEPRRSFRSLLLGILGWLPTRLYFIYRCD